VKCCTTTTRTCGCCTSSVSLATIPRSVHQRDRCHCVGIEDRVVLHGTPACRRESGRHPEVAGAEFERSDPDVRRFVAEHAEAFRRHHDSSGRLPGAWKTAARGSGAELSRTVPVCARIARPGLLQRRAGASAETIAGTPVAVSSALERSGDGAVTRLAGSAIREKEDRAELRPG